MSKFHLHLICPVVAEEKLMDVLLVNAADEVYTSVHVFDHGFALNSLSAEEQVMGRSRAVQLQLLLEEETLKSLLESIRRELKGNRIRYWATPVIFNGEIK